MLDKITWKDFIGWKAYSIIEPFDERRADLRAASIAQQVGNLFRKTPKSLEFYTLKFGDSVRPKQTQTWQEQKMIAKIRRIHRQGKSYRAISAVIGVPKSTIHRIISGNGPGRNRKCYN